MWSSECSGVLFLKHCRGKVKRIQKFFPTPLMQYGNTQEDQEFRVTLDDTVSRRSAWPAWEPVLKTKLHTQNKIENSSLVMLNRNIFKVLNLFSGSFYTWGSYPGLLPTSNPPRFLFQSASLCQKEAQNTNTESNSDFICFYISHTLSQMLKKIWLWHSKYSPSLWSLPSQLENWISVW